MSNQNTQSSGITITPLGQAIEMGVAGIVQPPSPTVPYVQPRMYSEKPAAVIMTPSSPFGSFGK